MYKISRLSNDLSVATYHMGGAFSVTVGIWFRVGSRYEDNAKAGISHVLEHMVFKGSKKYSADAIKRRIEGSGGQLNAFTSEELTCYLAKVPKKMAHPTFNILLDMVFHPRLRASDLEKEKAVIIEEIKMYNDRPRYMVQELLFRAMWPDNPLGRNIAGTIETVRSISQNTLSQFKKDYYRPKNMVIVFVGSIKHSDGLSFVRDAIKTKDATAHGVAFEPITYQQSQPTVTTRVKDIEQTWLAIGFTGYERLHPKRFILALIAIILGGNMSSRLFDKIREKRGLAYTIKCEYKPFIDAGAVYIEAGLDNQKIDLAIRLILSELHTLKTQCVPNAELKRAKEFALGHLAMLLEDTLEHMVFLGETVANTNTIHSFNYTKKHVLKVTPAQIREVARDIFRKEKVNISLVGPIKDFNSERCRDCIGKKLG